MEDEGPSILILGGLGFIGRHFVKYLLDYQLSQRIRVADKRVKAMVGLSTEFAELYDRPSVEIVQANLFSSTGVQKAFASSAKCPAPFQLVVNLAAETMYGLSEPVYDETITQLRILCAEQAARMGVDKYIEVSTAQVYSGSSPKGSKESDPIKPWTVLGAAHAKAEAAIAKIASLKYCVLRLPIVYGPGDVRGLMPRISVAASYAYTRERMELLWGEGLRLHTVHVQDVAACLWHLLCAGESREVYNIVDRGDTTQGKLNALLERLFPGLKTGYYNTVTSTLATVRGVEELVEDANSGHLAAWNQLCAESGISTTDIQPLLDKELLYNNHVALDGSKLEAAGFEVSCPNVTVDLLRESVDYWINLRKFPQRAL